MRRALVTGAAGFIGNHLVKRLKREGFWVRAADLHEPAYAPSPADEFLVADLTQQDAAGAVLEDIDDVYQFAADMGGAGYLFTGDHDASVLHKSAQINLNVLELGRHAGVQRFFFPSSACIYPEHNQLDPAHPVCSEDSAYPAAPDSEYGWEKLFAERVYLAYMRNYGLDVHISRLHNVFGPEGAYDGGREKAPAAICRKVAEAHNGGAIEVWGDGRQTRSWVFIDECIEGIRRLMESRFAGPVNIGSEEMVSIDQLAEMVIRISGKRLSVRHTDGPQGVRGRNSDNRLIREKLGWAPSASLIAGLASTYKWVAEQVSKINPDPVYDGEAKSTAQRA